MSSFKTNTYISIIDGFGEEMSESWVAETRSLTDSFWKDILVTKGAVKYVWRPVDWPDFSPSSYSILAMVSDGDLDVEMGSNTSKIFISGDTTISEDTVYHVRLEILSGITFEIEEGVTVTIDDSFPNFNSFRLSGETPFVLCSDDSYYDHSSTTDAAFGGTLGTINSIRVAEPSSASVNLTMVMSK